LAARLNEAGVHSRPSLVPGIGVDEWVRFSRLPFSNATIVFGREEALRTLLAAAIGSYGPLENLRLRGEEYRLSTGRRVDFLCEVTRGPNRGGQP
jgi:hypothetical protein